ncbi:hypothetical protein C0991_010055 [Blastosporella zonata]|nr:hypothetical protein C0991_010055 [Blastosporella zonata]
MSNLSPPAPFSDFDNFTFDPALSNLFPNPPPLPSSADLFSPDETLDLQVFLDNFGGLDWDLGAQEPLSFSDYTHNNTLAPYSNPHLNTSPEPSTSSHRNVRSAVSRATIHAARPSEIRVDYHARGGSESRTTSSPSDPASPTNDAEERDKPSRGTKPLLSTPQKRLNHIMSEQKRRNAIRDGYAQLISLLAPAGSKHGIGMPTRGRPKGSGMRGKGQTKGKSGVLFRAVEFCQWLEEGRDALRAEVLRVEAAAGIRHLGH